MSIPFLFFISRQSASVRDSWLKFSRSIRSRYPLYLASRSCVSFSFSSSSALVKLPRTVSSFSSAISICLRYSSEWSSSHWILSSSFVTVKFRSLEFHALNLLPSIDTNPVSISTVTRFTNSLYTFFMQSMLSFLKSEIVRKSGFSPPISHITSRFTLHAASSFLDDRMFLRYP